MRTATEGVIGVRVYTAHDVYLITAADLRAYPFVPEPAVRPTWDELVAIEPRLGRVLVEAARFAGMCWACRWYGRAGMYGLKAQVSDLVGWGSKHDTPLMHTRAAYDVAYHHVLDQVRDDPCRFHPGDYEESGEESW